MRSTVEVENHFYKYGWAILDLSKSSILHDARSALLIKLRQLTHNDAITLEQYHDVIAQDTEHTELQIQLTDFYRGQRFGPQIIANQLDFFRAFLGPDLKVQSNPYLRITRPGKPQDNIGYHRDTFYGGSPFELSVLVPFVDIPSESALSIIPGSHTHPESDYPTTKVTSTDIKKGSAKHQLGFLYAPKIISDNLLTEAQPISLKVGQALIFSLAAVHGSIENQGKISRWSSDIRIVNALAPVDLSARPDYYEYLSQSVVTKCSEIYFKSNE